MNTRLLIFGNSGSGKSTYSKALAQAQSLAHLDLDTIVWEPGKIAVPRAAEDVRRSLEEFLAANSSWVIEGCYSELIEATAQRATQLIFLNPGLDACLANNRRRPWEPHKYESAAKQDEMLDALQAWVAGYYNRDDPWSYAAHRRVFDAHTGPKVEHTQNVSV